MVRATRFVGIFIGAILVLAAFSAHARRGSVLINKRAIRKQMSALVKGNSLRLGKPLLGPTRGISPRAYRKARQTAQGFNGFNWRAGAKSYAVNRGKGRNLVVTTANISSYVSGRDARLNYFVARDGKSGVVVGRGFIDSGKINWTRSKNERGRLTPSERNAAGR